MNRRANVAIGVVFVLFGLGLTALMALGWEDVGIKEWFKAGAILVGVVCAGIGVGGILNRIDMVKWVSEKG